MSGLSEELWEGLRSGGSDEALGTWRTEMAAEQQTQGGQKTPRRREGTQTGQWQSAALKQRPVIHGFASLILLPRLPQRHGILWACPLGSLGLVLYHPGE